MKSVNFIRLMFFGIAIVFSVLVFSAPDKKVSGNSEEQGLEENKEKCEDKKVKSDMILWETIGRHLFSSR